MYVGVAVLQRRSCGKNLGLVWDSKEGPLLPGMLPAVWLGNRIIVSFRLEKMFQIIRVQRLT